MQIFRRGAGWRGGGAARQREIESFHTDRQVAGRRPDLHSHHIILIVDDGPQPERVLARER
jgi:hypothetical protein